MVIIYINFGLIIHLLHRGSADTRNYQPLDLVFHSASPRGIPDPRVGNFWYQLHTYAISVYNDFTGPSGDGDT